MTVKYKCEWCGYTSKESEFLNGYCPACCADLFTGEVSPNSIPTVFHMPTKQNEDDNETTIPPR